MKLSDYKGEEALDKLVDLLEPVIEITSDKEIAALAKEKPPVFKIVRLAIKNHKKQVIEILAILDGEDPKTYAEKVNLFTLPIKLLEVLNDPELMSLFTSQGKKLETLSTSATESSTESAQ